MKWRLMTISLLVVLTAGLTTFIFVSKNRELSIVTVALAYSPPPCKPEFVPYLVALHEGMFERRGIRVETIKFQSDPKGKWSEDIVIGHADDFYRQSNLEAFSYRPFLAHYSSQELKNFAIFAPPNLGATKSTGRLVLAYEDPEHGSGAIPTKLIETFQSHWKGRALNVEIKKMRRDQILNRRSHFDMVLATEPFISILNEVKWIEMVEVPTQQLLPDAWITGFTAISSNYLKLNPGTSEQLIAAWWEAIDHLRANPEAVNKITRECMEKEQGISRSLLPVGHWKTNEIPPKAFDAQMKIFHVPAPANTKLFMTNFFYHQ